MNREKCLQAALEAITIRIGAPGEIVNGTQRGRALDDVRAIAMTALFEAAHSQDDTTEPLS